MKILMIGVNDPAGMMIAFTNAINRHTDHVARSITLQTRYSVNFESDLHLPDLVDDDYGEVEHLLRTSDVFHFHMLMDENNRLGPLLPRDYVAGKRVLHHEHGHPDFLVNAETSREKARRLGRRAVVSTPDLLRLWPEATWQPNFVPQDDVAFLPREDRWARRTRGRRDEPPVRICQAPTRKWHKHTREFREVTAELARDFHLEVVVVENRPYAECLRIKRTCDVVFDHMLGHFGISSLESLAQGVPVIAGLDELNLREIAAYTGTAEHPWAIARDRRQLKDRLVELIENPELREQIGRASRRYMEETWTDRRAVELLCRTYASLPVAESVPADGCWWKLPRS